MRIRVSSRQSSQWKLHHEIHLVLSTVDKNNYKGWFVSPNTPTRGLLFYNSVTSYAYGVVNVMEDNNYATVFLSLNYLCE